MGTLRSLALLVTIVGAGLITRECFPRVLTVQSIPRIVTVYDTVVTAPVIRRVNIATTDTVNVVIRETLHIRDTIYVGSELDSRPNINPILRGSFGSDFGDTSEVVSFSLRTGIQTTSHIFTPGYITSIEVRPDTVTPRMNFTPFPVYSVHTWDKVKYGFYGFVFVASAIASFVLTVKAF